jgi:hypothetical protein
VKARRVRAWLLCLVACTAAVAVGRPPSANVVDAPAHVDSRPSRFATTFDVSTFQKGNVHTHTNRSDGDSSPEEVIAWYRAQGYQFLALTDHNLRSEPIRYRSLQDDHFILIPGEEVTMTAAGRQVHVNSLCSRWTVGGGAFGSAADALAWALSVIDAQHGVALVNHPNFDRGLSAADLLAVAGASLLEIKSGHPYVYSDGVEDRPSHEALWDRVLSRGTRTMGVAVDDTHRLIASGDPPAYPGFGWVEVFAQATDADAICDALRGGMLYASTGAELARVHVEGAAYSVTPRAAGAVTFIGRNGEALRQFAVGAGEAATYDLRGDETYVRARIESADGAAWAPAVFVAR